MLSTVEGVVRSAVDVDGHTSHLPSPNPTVRASFELNRSQANSADGAMGSRAAMYRAHRVVPPSYSTRTGGLVMTWAP